MTGFGRAAVQAGRFNLTVEARSVNQKGLHIHLNIPDQLLHVEQDIREEIRNRFSRGRIDLRMNLEPVAGVEDVLPVDLERARELARSAVMLAAELRLDPSLTVADLMKLPGVLKLPFSSDMPDAGLVLDGVRTCLEGLTESRRAEGRSLAGLLAARLTRIRSLASSVAASQQESVSACFEKLRERVRRLLGEVQVDEQRMFQELAIISDRLDVSEELERLECHVESALSLAASSEADAGRKLGFLLQELQREINTLGSKLESPGGTMTVIEMKNELASLREQVANVE